MSASISMGPARRISVLLGGTGRPASSRRVPHQVGALLRPRSFNAPASATFSDGHRHA